MIQVSLIRATRTVTDDEARSFAAALQRAADLHFAAAWAIPVTVTFIAPGQVIPEGSYRLWLRDRTTIPGDLGFHDVEDGIVTGQAFVDDARVDGVPWSLPASHEAWEMLVNPTISALVPMAHNGVAGVTNKEVADPVEDPACAFEVEGLGGVKHLISAFVTPAYFDPAGRAPFSYPVLAAIDGPFTAAPGGYQPWAPNGGAWTQIMAETWGPMQFKRTGSRFSRMPPVGLDSQGTGA